MATFKRLRAATATTPDITTTPELSLGASVEEDGDILAYIRNTTITLYHAGATCAMGRKNDTRAVVDAQARVFGVQNLHVVQSTAYMLAEKIVEAILVGMWNLEHPLTQGL